MFNKERKALLQELASMGIRDARVLEAISKVHRHLFIPPEMQDRAYLNIALPLLEEQTISQPFTVAFMLEALEIEEGMKILEVGTGSGWNAALLAELVGSTGKVISTELLPTLVKYAKEKVKPLKYKQLKIVETDGSEGYEKEAPYDRIIATAACPRIPEEWKEQLKADGIIVAPVETFIGQTMITLVKKNNTFSEEQMGGFLFVPLKGKHGIP